MNTWTFRVAAAVLGLVFIGALGYGLTHAGQPFSSKIMHAALAAAAAALPVVKPSRRPFVSRGGTV